MNKLQDAIDKPTTSFHASFKKSNSDGFSYQCEADISPAGITGRQTDFTPATSIGGDVFPATTHIRELHGTPVGSPDWSMTRGGLEMTFLGGHLGDAQEGVRPAGQENTGGFVVRRYDFDLANVDATIKRAMGVANALHQGRQVKDYNMRGSAWIATDTGQLVKFNYDTIMSFANGENYATHYEGALSRR